MSDDIPGLGPRTGRPQPTPHSAVAGLPLRPEDWFLLSRIDGQTNLQSLFLLSPKGEAETIEMLKRLLDADLISLAGASRAKATPSVPGRPGAPTLESATSAGRLALPTDWPTPFDRFHFDPALMAQAPTLDDGFKRQLLYVHDQMRRVSHYQLFGVAQGALDRDVKIKYLRYAKAFHPDRFFRQDLGPWRALIEDVYRWVNAAYQTLQDDTARRAYDASLVAARRPTPPPAPPPAAPPPGGGFGVRPASQTLQNLPALLLEAKRLERDGDVAQALSLYEAALAKKRAPEVLLRAAECLIRLRARLDVAERYCREAAQLDPSQSRFWAALAYAVELQGRAAEAATHYAQAVALDPSNHGAQARLRRLTTP